MAHATISWVDVHFPKVSRRLGGLYRKCTGEWPQRWLMDHLQSVAISSSSPSLPALYELLTSSSSGPLSWKLWWVDVHFTKGLRFRCPDDRKPKDLIFGRAEMVEKPSRPPTRHPLSTTNSCPPTFLLQPRTTITIEGKIDKEYDHWGAAGIISRLAVSRLCVARLVKASFPWCCGCWWANHAHRPTSIDNNNNKGKW